MHLLTGSVNEHGVDVLHESMLFKTTVPLHQTLAKKPKNATRTLHDALVGVLNLP